MLYQLSMIYGDRESSTYHDQCEAESAREAVELYVNKPATVSTGARTAQTRGCVVVVGPSDGGSGYRCYGVELFAVGPAIERGRAVVVGRVHVPHVPSREEP